MKKFLLPFLLLVGLFIFVLLPYEANKAIKAKAPSTLAFYGYTIISEGPYSSIMYEREYTVSKDGKVFVVHARLVKGCIIITDVELKEKI